jgi:hypothetical protein
MPSYCVLFYIHIYIYIYIYVYIYKIILISILLPFFMYSGDLTLNQPTSLEGCDAIILCLILYIYIYTYIYIYIYAYIYKIILISILFPFFMYSCDLTLNQPTSLEGCDTIIFYVYTYICIFKYTLHVFLSKEYYTYLFIVAT